ncbi:hypothetical protein RIF29_36086 [Crotalaria pallida]|uniref:Zinc finger RING-type eukaryotic domain-containing protein n=1 Tax=Crotalaria pallida TaxID=3830 RepID=A0AAN9EAP2_CROPI
MESKSLLRQSNRRHRRRHPSNLKTRDFFFKIKITALAEIHSANDDNHDTMSSDDDNHDINTMVVPLFETSMTLSSKQVFEGDAQDFLHRFLPTTYVSVLSLFSTTLSLQRMSRQIIREFQQIMLNHRHDDHEETREVEIVIRVENVSSEFMEELMVMSDADVNVNMVPASKITIESLKAYKLPRYCQICIEKFHYHGDHDERSDDDDDVIITPMPCGHVFHHGCICVNVEGGAGAGSNQHQHGKLRINKPIELRINKSIEL